MTEHSLGHLLSLLLSSFLHPSSAQPRITSASLRLHLDSSEYSGTRWHRWLASLLSTTRRAPVSSFPQHFGQKTIAFSLGFVCMHRVSRTLTHRPSLSRFPPCLALLARRVPWTMHNLDIHHHHHVLRSGEADHARGSGTHS